MQVRDELRVLVEAEVARAIENFKKLEGSIDGAEHKTKSLGEALDSFSKKSMVVSAALGGAGIAAVKFAGENEKLKLSLKNMLGSAEEASAVFEEWRRLGNSPGLNPDEVFELGRAMVNMGHDTAYATKTIQMLGNVAAGTGKSFGAVSGTFEHVRAAGKLTARDLASLQQQGIPILKQLAKELNTSEEGVRRLTAEGKIGFTELEKAFRSMTGPGGRFAGMMDELSGTTFEKFSTAANDAKQALASFGELLLPMATELLESASSILRGFNDMDEGTKRFVISMGSVVAISGPAIKAIRGIASAAKFLAANPIALAIGAGAAGLGSVFAIINDFGEKGEQAARDYHASISQMSKDNEELLRSAESFESVGNKIRGLSRSMYDAARETGNYAAANEAAVRLITLNQKLAYVTRQADEASEGLINQAGYLINILNEPLDPDAVSHWGLSYATEIERIDEALRSLHSGGSLNSELNRALVQETGWVEAVASKNTEGMLQALRSIDGRSPEARAEIARIQNEINDLTRGLTIQPLPEDGGPSVDFSAAKKRWEDWYGEITKIDPAAFGDSGSRAAELYLAEFSRSLEAGKTIFAALGEEFNIAETLRGQQSAIQKALVELFSINPTDIDDPFELIDKSIEPLIAEYQRLGEAAKEAEDAMKSAEYAHKIEDLKKKIEDFGKSESQLAYDAAIAGGALTEQAEEIKRLMDEYRRIEILDEYNRQIQEIGKSQNELAIAAYAAAGATEGELAAFKATLDLRDELRQAEELKKTLEGIRGSLADLGASSALSGIESLGNALGQGANAGEAMRGALAAMSQEILDALPNLFLQAGLQLIAQGQWPLGLGFVAAAGSASLIKGYVGGKIESERNTANAHGNVFDAGGIQAFARGGTFTNQIVSQPTLFEFAQGTGLMGEAGPEAIVPLKRMANGDLGISANGGNSSQVTVNIINNSGAEVRQEEREGIYGGRQIDITIGEIVNSHIASGKADRVIGSRYNLRAAGV